MPIHTTTILTQFIGHSVPRCTNIFCSIIMPLVNSMRTKVTLFDAHALRLSYRKYLCLNTYKSISMYQHVDDMAFLIPYVTLRWFYRKLLNL